MIIHFTSIAENILYTIKVNVGCRELQSYTPNCPQTTKSIEDTEYFISPVLDETLIDDKIKNWRSTMAELQRVMAAIEVYKHINGQKALAYLRQL